MWCFKKETFMCVFVLTIICVLTQGGSSAAQQGSYRSSNAQKSTYNGLSYANGDYNQRQTSDAKTKVKSSRGLGISAWGLVAVILSLILGGIFVYYAVLFYPILCKKQRKYDMMELGAV